MRNPQTELFAQLHLELLKPGGFRKTSSRSERSFGSLHQAVVCFSSRFNSATSYSFTLECRVGHEAFFHMLQPGKAFPGLFGAVMPMLSWRPRDPVDGGEIWWDASGSVDVRELKPHLLDVARRQVLPDLELTRSLEGIVEFCAVSNDWFHFRPRSWALNTLGNERKAREVIDKAMASAPHSSARGLAEEWATKLFG
jgi:hypothetical protein